MARVNHIQTNFTAGELSPRLEGRVDFAKYFNGVARMENMTVMPHGGVTKRPGFRYVAAAGYPPSSAGVRRTHCTTEEPSRSSSARTRPSASS